MAVGEREVNFLVLAAVTRRFRVPLIWTALGHRGRSDAGRRIALMRRHLKLFPATTIRLLLADREFIGLDRMKFLNDNDIPFAIRVKDRMIVATEDGRRLALGSLLRKCRGVRTLRAALEREDRPRDALWLNFAAKRLKGGERLILATNAPTRRALADHRKRWAIESLFGDAKTRGLNLEDTRLGDPRKLDLLMALVAFALAWAAKAAVVIEGSRAPKRKSHGHLAQSWFRTGFDRIRNLLRTDPLAAIDPCLRLPPKPARTTRVL